MRAGGILYLCALVLSMCATSAKALAYSPEAVADGEKLLIETLERARAGEATAQDLAIVRYHLLEMKLGAGRISRQAFCPLARAELLAMAKAGGDEETRAGIEELGEKISSMTISPELCQQASMAVDSFLFGERTAKATEAQVADDERAAAQAVQDYREGRVNRTLAAQAEANSLETQFSAGTLDRAAYCRSRQGEVLNDLARWVEEEAKVGKSALLERLDARRRLFRFKALCSKPSR